MLAERPGHDGRARRRATSGRAPRRLRGQLVGLRRHADPAEDRDDDAAAALALRGVASSTCEQLMRVFAALYGLETVSLRYFNVFGPRQDPKSQYAAVIPKFITAALDRASARPSSATASRRATSASSRTSSARTSSRPRRRRSSAARSSTSPAASALAQPAPRASSAKQTGTKLEPDVPGRRAPGDVRDSLASIDAARELFGYEPKVKVREGLAEDHRGDARVDSADVRGVSDVIRRRRRSLPTLKRSTTRPPSFEFAAHACGFVLERTIAVVDVRDAVRRGEGARGTADSGPARHGTARRGIASRQENRAGSRPIVRDAASTSRRSSSSKRAATRASATPARACATHVPCASQPPAPATARYGASRRRARTRRARSTSGASANGKTSTLPRGSASRSWSITIGETKKLAKMSAIVSHAIAASRERGRARPSADEDGERDREDAPTPTHANDRVRARHRPRGVVHRVERP